MPLVTDGSHDTRGLGHCQRRIKSYPAILASFCQGLPIVTIRLVTRIFRKGRETPIPRPIMDMRNRATRGFSK